MGHIENDMVLGPSRYKSGVRATMFAWSDKGIGYLIGEGTAPRIVCTSYVAAEMRDAVFAEWEPEQLTLALKPYGVAVGQVWGTDPSTGKGANRRGITRSHIAGAIAKRDGRPEAA